MKAKQIIKNSIQQYASCQSYRDCGLLTQETFSQLPQNNSTKTYQFTTTFVSKNKFLVEIRELQQDQTILWSDGKSVLMYYKYNHDDEASVRRFSDLEELSKHHILDFNFCPIFTLPLLVSTFKHPASEIFDNNFRIKKSTDDRYHLKSYCRPVVFLDLYVRKSDFSLSEIEIENHQMTRLERKVLKIQYESIEFDSIIPDEIFDFKPSNQ